MFDKIIKIICIILLYQTPLYSKSTSFVNFNAGDLSSYFSGLVALENNDYQDALKYFNSSKVLLNNHDPFLEKYVITLVKENKIQQAIDIIKKNSGNNKDFFEAYLLLILDSLKRDNFEEANLYLKNISYFSENNKFNSAIIETLNEYIYVFKEKKLFKKKTNYGNLSLITETFQRCYLDDPKTIIFFSNLINRQEADYTRYVYFFLSYLVKKNKSDEIEKILPEINYINSTLLLSQGKSWIINNNLNKFENVFSCQDHNDIIGEFLFLISNLYSSQDDIERSNFFLHLSNFSNKKFVYNASLLAENYYFNKDYKKTKKILKRFNDNKDDFYFWFRKKKEAQIIAKLKTDEESLNFINSEFSKIKNPNNKIIFDIANFHKNSGDYETAIKYYSQLIENLDDNLELKADILYRRGGSYERKGDDLNSDKDLLESLKINPDNAYVLNYLAYSWLERNYKIDEALKMLETAYSFESDDPYIIDSIGWAYFLINDYIKAKEFLIRAVELMPEDPIVNDHYGDILWKLDQKIQARYFWNNVLKMKDVEKDMIKKINDKLIYGLENS